MEDFFNVNIFCKNINVSINDTLFKIIENNFIRIKVLVLAKNYEQAKNKARLAVPQNIRKKCQG